MTAFFFMHKKFEIYEIGSSAFQKRLEECALPYRGNLRPINFLLQSLNAFPLHCKTVVFESEYVDKDYQDEFSAFYSKSFKKYPHRCVRLHFFSSKIPNRTRLNFGKYKNAYLGFMVLRPTDLQRMGRTVVRPTLTDPDKQYVHCKSVFATHILGDEFKVEGMPFVQQDTQVGACAQASLWMAARYMSAKFGYREYLPSEINTFAKTNMALGRPLPAERGLNFTQMLDALKGMGFSALSYSLGSIDDCSDHIEKFFPVDPSASPAVQKEQMRKQRMLKLADIAYRYIESSLPVIFCTSNHALVGIGHTYDPTKIARVAIERIPAFYVNNDNSGPYIQMPILTPSSGELTFSEVSSIIAIVPSEATLRGEEAESMSRACVEEFLANKIPSQPASTYAKLIGEKLRPDLKSHLLSLEYRTFLVPSTQFQSSLRKEIRKREIDRKIGVELLRLDYPKFIWITEISSSALLNQPVSKNRKCIGRIIIDSTAPARTRGAIAIHFVDFLQLLNRQDHDVKWSYCPNSTPFGHKVLC